MKKQVILYDKWVKEYDKDSIKYNKEDREVFYSFFNFPTKNKKLLDVACASGYDLLYYRNVLKCDVYGIDSSEKQVKIAQERIGTEKVKVGYSYKIPFKNNEFDIVVSRYAIQAFEDVEKFYKEVARVLKPGGILIILGTHPIRHFREKTKKPRNYFKKEMVISWIFNHTLPLEEYTHNFNDYFSSYFFKNFSMNGYIEAGYKNKKGMMRVDNENYPGYFIYRAIKK